MHESEEGKKSFLKERLIPALKDLGLLVIRSVDEMNNNNVNILASGLVYSTLVAVIPCVSFLFVFLSMFGVLQPFITALYEVVQDVLGMEVGTRLADTLSTYTSNAMGLGIFGLVSFAITAVLLVNKIYLVLNQIFRTQPRTGMVKRFLTFFTFLVICAVLLTLFLTLQSRAINVLNSLSGTAKQNSFLIFIQGASSIFVVFILLFMLYYFVPNAKVKASSAFIGSLTGTIALYISTLIFKNVISTFVSFSVIYGSLTSLFIGLLFLYVDWYIILVAAELAYTHQFKPEHRVSAGMNDSPSKQISDSVNMIMLIGDYYKKGEGAIPFKTLSRRLALPPQTLFSYLDLFRSEGIILAVSRKNTSSYVPARPLDQIYVRDVVNAIFGYRDENGAETAGEAVSEQIKTTSISSFKDLTIENLLERI